MYNRYQGNSGRVERVPDAPQPSIRPRPPAPPAGNNMISFAFSSSSA